MGLGEWVYLNKKLRFEMFVGWVVLYLRFSFREVFEFRFGFYGFYRLVFCFFC